MIHRNDTDKSELDTARKIEQIKARWRSKLVILGHHYQKEEVIAHADFTGDSLELCHKAAKQKEAAYIVFCGVHFMAESADILTTDDQIVQLPNLEAGCPLADFANIDQVQDVWNHLHRIVSVNDIIPITYINSRAELKAFCGEHQGAVCTSSNAESMLKWAFKRGEKVFFFPDQNLGRNTALKMNIPADEIVLWNDDIIHDVDRLNKARVILWDGYCYVHRFFTVKHIETVRNQYPDVKVIVHPECDADVVQASDDNGSTGYILKYVEHAPAGSVIAIGTEYNLVHRLAARFTDKTVIPLSTSFCATMNKISALDLLYTLENLGSYHLIRVPDSVKQNAKIALDRMFHHD
ncbi:quinolinate synthase NadA [candidate division KSB1 bacterium]|nr:quinolinate synthase NadA [candidate division KSB1 bacterium]